MTLEIAIRTVLGAAETERDNEINSGRFRAGQELNDALVLVRQLVAPWVVPEDA